MQTSCLNAQEGLLLSVKPEHRVGILKSERLQGLHGPLAVKIDDNAAEVKDDVAYGILRFRGDICIVLSHFTIRIVNYSNRALFSKFKINIFFCDFIIKD